MNREELKVHLEKLDRAYDRLTFDREKVNLWYDCFKDCNSDVFEQAVMNYIKSNEYPPNIAGIMKHCNEIESYKKEMSAFITRQLTTLLNTWGEANNEETRNEFLKMVVEKPKALRKEFATNYVNEAVNYFHKCEYDSKPAPILINYLRGER